MNGAFAYKQTGKVSQAVHLYQLFVERYGTEEKLATLEKERPAALKERLKYLTTAYDSLAAAHVLTFDYQGAAELFLRIAGQTRFEAGGRKRAARNAAILYSKLGPPKQAATAFALFVALKPTVIEKVEIELTMAISASEALEPWQPNEGAQVRKRRRAAMSALEKVVKDYSHQREAAGWVVEAAYRLARAAREERDKKWVDWCKKVEAAFEVYQHRPGVDPALERDTHHGRQAAECAYWRAAAVAQADFAASDLKKPFATPKELEAALKKVQGIHEPALQKVVDRFKAPESALAARAEQGRLYAYLRERMPAAAANETNAQREEREKRERSLQAQGLKYDVEALEWGRAAASRAAPLERQAALRVALSADSGGVTLVKAAQAAFEASPGAAGRLRASRGPFAPMGKLLLPAASAVALPLPVKP